MILDVTTLPHPLRFEEIFGRRAPIEIEIGVGKGRFLRERATALPERDFFGIEKSKKYLLHAADRIRKAELANVRLAVTYAEGFIERFIPDQSVAAYHILFPDPWPKHRHTKRRLFTPLFLDQILRTLEPEGELHIATDYLEYFKHINEQLYAYFSKGLETNPVEPGPFLSNFQAKYLKEGRPLFFLKGIKRAGGSALQTRERTPPPAIAS
ncbi:MAG: tRNA (guanosine(46)-N7)-methyltransferase TrmB [Pseudomonadota bacterium]